jgi:hypothetical protein
LKYQANLNILANNQILAMKKLILSLSEVAGTGRTTFCEALHGLLKQKRVAHLLAHTDPERPSGLSPSSYLDPAAGLGVEDFIALLDEAPVVVLDLTTGETEEFLSLYERSELADVLGEIDAALTLVLSATSNSRTETTLLEVAEVFRDDADYIVLRGPDFRGWGMPNAGRAMHHLGAVEIAVPPLPIRLATFVDGGEAVLPRLLSGHTTLPRSEQGALDAWEIQYYTAMEGAGEFLWTADAIAAAPTLPPGRTRIAGRGRRVIRIKTKGRDKA